MADYFQVIRGGGWQYGSIPCRNGMVVAWQPGNNDRLVDAHMLAPYDGDVENVLPRCETCDCWFVSDAMYAGHLNSVHAQGLTEMKRLRAGKIDVLSALRDESAALTERINTLHAAVLALDKEIAGKEAELAAAQQPAADGVHMPNVPVGRMTLAARDS